MQTLRGSNLEEAFHKAYVSTRRTKVSERRWSSVGVRMDVGDVAFWMFWNFPSGVPKERDVLERCRQWRLQSWSDDEP